MNRPPRVITDLTGEQLAMYVAVEMTLEESQAVERALRMYYDPKLPVARATLIGNLISAFAKANERAEGTEY